MGSLGNCCCGCCMEPAEMPWTKFSLKNTLANCTTGGGYTPPEASFIRVGCCYQATMNVECDWEYLCQDYAKQTATVSLTLDDYQVQIPYITEGQTPSCPCTLVQRRSGTRTITANSQFFHKRKLTQIQVTVGKTNYDCGTGSPSCKFYIAVNYWYDIKEYLSDLCSGFTHETLDRTCTGLYRDGTCSYTNSWTEESGSNDCTDYYSVLDTEAASSLSTCIGRIKYYDVLPTGDVVISDADESSPCAPVTCGVCDGPDCFYSFPQYAGSEPRFFYGSALDPVLCPCEYTEQCYDYDGFTGFPGTDGGFLVCFREPGCPDIVEGSAKTFSVPVFICSIGNEASTPPEDPCCVTVGDVCTVSGNDPDGFKNCFYFIDKSTNEIREWITSPDMVIPGITYFCLGGDSPPPVSAGCFKEVGTSNCADEGKCKDCRPPAGCVYIFCQDLSGGGDDITDFKYCKREITSYSCTIGDIQHFTAGNFCINTPSTTLGFA